MSSVHAAPPHPVRPGWCAWRWHWEDVDLECTDRAIPGERFCADHLIEVCRFDATKLDDAARAAPPTSARP